MGLDIFGEGLTPEQARLSEQHIRPNISSMVHGDIAYITAPYYWPDADGKLWIDLNAPRYDVAEIEEVYDDLYDHLVRVVRIDSNGIRGFLVDVSWLEFHNTSSEENKLDVKTGEGFDTGVNREPVLAWIGDEFVLEAAASHLNRQFGIELGECAVKSLMNTESFEGDED